MNFAVHSCLLILIVDFGDFLDGVVARYCLEITGKKLEKKPKPQITDGTVSDSSDEGFHVVSTGSSHSTVSLAGRYPRDLKMMEVSSTLSWVCIYCIYFSRGIKYVAFQFAVWWTLVLVEVASAAIIDVT